MGRSLLFGNIFPVPRLRCMGKAGLEGRMGEIKPREKISGVVIAYNDAPNMRKCLESLSWVDELIVIDSHSTDGTTEPRVYISITTPSRDLENFETRLLRMRPMIGFSV